MWGYGYGDAGWAGWLVMGLMMLLFWAIVIGGVVFLVRSTGRNRGGDGGAGGSDARRILDERFARGEIDTDEYAKRRQVLSSP